MTYQIVSERKGADCVIKSPHDAYSVLERYGKKKQEHFIVLTLSGNHSVIKTRIITIGLLNRTMVHPREIFKGAIDDLAAAIIVAHNHPSGNLEPSPEDRNITEQLVSAGKLMGIPVLDHIIFSKASFCSLNETTGLFSGGQR